MTNEPITYPSTAHALGCGMNNGRPVIACICGLPNKSLGVPATLGAGEAANSPAFRAIKIPPMPEEPALSITGYMTRDGKSEIVSVRRDELDDWMTYAQQLTRIAQEQADRADAAEAKLAAINEHDEALDAAHRRNMERG